MTDNELILVQRCASFGEYSTRYLRQHRVAEASRRNRYAVASAPSADVNIRHSIHQNLRNAVLAISEMMDRKLGSVKNDIRDIKLTMEKDILPRLQNIESCYTTIYKRYQSGVNQIDGI